MKVTGRDLSEQELGLRLAAPRCQWECQGDGQERDRTAQQHEVLEALGKAPLRDIADATGKTAATCLQDRSDLVSTDLWARLLGRRHKPEFVKCMTAFEVSKTMTLGFPRRRCYTVPDIKSTRRETPPRGQTGAASMPISTSSFGDERDGIYNEYDSGDRYDQETLDFPGISPAQAETFLKRLGGGVEEKLRRVEGIGWKAAIEPTDTGVAVTFQAHDELLDDLIRRFEEWVDREG